MLAFAIVLALTVLGTCSFAAGKANLSVSKNGKTFKLTSGKQSYSFRYDWNKKKKRFTGYNQKIINKLTPKRGLLLSVQRENAKNHRDDSIVISKGVTLNKKIYIGIPLASFHKKIGAAWGDGYYGYYSTKKGKAVKVGTKKPTDKFVKKRSKDTGLYWAGDRGRLRINASIQWNSKKNRAEINWIEIFVPGGR